MTRWFRDHMWMIGMLVSTLAYIFTTFASIKYVDDKHLSVQHQLDRMDDKLDRLLQRLR